MNRKLLLPFLSLLSFTHASLVFAKPIGIHFSAAALSLQSDSALNNNFQSVASRVRWDVYMPGSINSNGFVSIDANQVKLRLAEGQVKFRTKSGSGNCDGSFTSFEQADYPSSAELVRLDGNLAYVRIRTPQATRLFEDPSQSTFCTKPRFSLFATNLDGSSPPGSTIINTFFPNPYRMDGPNPGSNVDNHLVYAEFPMNVETPAGGPYQFRFVHSAATGTSLNKVVWFGQVSIDNNNGGAPQPVDAYALGGYSLPGDPTVQPPLDPPVIGGGSTPGQIPTSEITTWIKDSVHKLLQGLLSIFRAGAAPTAIPQSVTLYATAPVGSVGAYELDPTTKQVRASTSATAPASGLLTILLEFKNPTTGKIVKVRLAPAQATAGSSPTLNFTLAGKLLQAVTRKGKVTGSITYSFKAPGLKKAITVSRKLKL